MKKAKDSVGDIIIYLSDYCNQMGFDLDKIVRETWERVKKRDWRANPKTGKKLKYKCGCNCFPEYGHAPSCMFDNWDRETEGG